jgi:hypothetical protein
VPKIEPVIFRTVFYIYTSEDDAKNNSEYGATGFFFGEDSELIPGKTHYYAVTNAHVAFGESMENPVLRINTTNKTFDIIKTSREDWIRHSDADDIAICPVEITSYEISAACLTRGLIADDAFLKEYAIGAGDDVFMVGRFRVHAGREKNVPTVRFGNIAAMNEEPLYNDFTKLEQESYLVEMRSIAGFSGSPVFIQIHPLNPRFNRSPDQKETINIGTINIPVRLLGIQWGQISYTVIAKDENDQKYRLKVDSAMEGVVPIQKLMDLIDSQEIVGMRKKLDQKVSSQFINET